MFTIMGAYVLAIQGAKGISNRDIYHVEPCSFGLNTLRVKKQKYVFAVCVISQHANVSELWWTGDANVFCCGQVASNFVHII